MPIKPSTSQACNTQTCTECKFEVVSSSNTGSMVFEYQEQWMPNPPLAPTIHYLWNGKFITSLINNHYTINNCYRSGSWCYYTGQFKEYNPPNTSNKVFEICRRA